MSHSDPNGKPRPTDELDPVQRRHYVAALKMLRDLNGEDALAELAERIMSETHPGIDVRSVVERKRQAMGAAA